MNRLLGKTKQSKSKNRAFKKIKEKYDIEENPIEPVLLDAKTHSFKFVKHTHVKSVHARLHAFVRLVDFLVQETLR